MSTERPISEIFAVEGIAWAKAEARASLLEDTKSSFLSQKIMDVIQFNGGMAYNRAEAEVKASADWIRRIHDTIEARKEANLLKVRIESLRMAYGEWNSAAADERLQNKLAP